MEIKQLPIKEFEQPIPYRVMVVDDNEIELKLYANGLAKHFTMVFAKSSKQAWDLINRTPLPDAIILDIMMPNEDGLSLGDRIKENQFTRDIPIIFISALSGPTIKSQAFEIGGADFITKPPIIAELVAKINRHIRVYRKTKRLESLIFIDPLTHLPNASKFKEVLKQEWSRCARYWHHLSLLLIRINNMPKFRLAHSEDEYYRLTAAIAQDLSPIGGRPGDFLASLGNDVFALLLCDCSNKGASMKSEEIMNRFNNPNFIASQQANSPQITCTISQAVAAPAGGGACEQLFEMADKLLFEAQQRGDGQIFKNENILGVDNQNSDDQQ
ncbi:MAG: diguanylate cyclase (GGDEF)-like protein [Patiriisocius sp.]|jgi:diguanylate cyclase (GGDEF)-like protein